MAVYFRVQRVRRALLPLALSMVFVAARSDSRDQEEARLHFKIAEIAMKRGDDGAAVSELTKAVALEPGNAVYHYTLAVAQKALDPRAALESVRRARKLGLPGSEKEAALTLEAELTYETARLAGPADPGPAARTNTKDGLEYVSLPPGEFQMGCLPQDSRCNEDERPAHAVRIPRAFWIGRSEVTVGAFGTWVAKTGYRTAAEQEGWAHAWNGKSWGRQPGLSWKNPGFTQAASHPVVAVAWSEAAAFCAWAGGRLPTEAEWEYAARGGQADQIYPFAGAATHDFANFGKDKGGPMIAGRDQWDFTAPSGSFPPNGFGLYDMAGNAWEWTADWFGPYSDGPKTAPTGATGGQYRVLRGGSWNFGPWVLRASSRYGLDPTVRSVNLGFRCARDAAP